MIVVNFLDDYSEDEPDEKSVVQQTPIEPNAAFEAFLSSLDYPSFSFSSDTFRRFKSNLNLTSSQLQTLDRIDHLHQTLQCSIIQSSNLEATLSLEYDATTSTNQLASLKTKITQLHQQIDSQI